jgi:hypothetical protein
VSLVTEVDASFQELTHAKIRQCHAFVSFSGLTPAKQTAPLSAMPPGGKLRISP